MVDTSKRVNAYGNGFAQASSPVSTAPAAPLSNALSLNGPYPTDFGLHLVLTNPIIYGTITLNGIEWTPPSSTGTAGEVLTTDGAGNWSWTPAVHTLSFGTTGLIPSSPTSEEIVVDGVLNISHGGTGAVTAKSAMENLLPDQVGHNGESLTTDGSGNLYWTAAAGTGTVKSIDVVGGTTGLTTSGGPVTSIGTITLGGTLGIANGGTGQTTANAALNALLPSQSGQDGKVLITDGTNTSWNDQVDFGVASLSAGTTGLLPSTATKGNVVLSGTLNISHGGTGATTQAGAANAVLPDQSGKNGQFLKTDGANVSWTSGVDTTFSGGTTGLLPNTPTSGDIVLSGTLNEANGGTGITALGTGVQTGLGANVNGANGFVTYSGNLGTPTAGVLTNATGLPISTGVSGLGNNVADALEINTGVSGSVVTFNGAGGTPTSITLTHGTGLPISTGVSGLGFGIATALETDVGTAGSVVLFDDALGEPTSGDFSTGSFTWPTFNQDTTGTADNVTGVVAIANGGTGQTDRGAAFNALAPSQTVHSGQFLTTDGSDAFWASVPDSMVYPSAGVPVSTGSAWGSSITLGSGVQTALGNDTNSAGGIVLYSGALGTPTSGDFSTGTFTWPTFNQDTTGTAGNVSGIVAIANGGTGADNASGAMVNLLPDQTSQGGKVLSTDGSGTLQWITAGGGGGGGPLNTSQTVAGASVTVTTGSSFPATIISTTITVGTNPVLVNVSGDACNTIAAGYCFVRLYRDSTPIGNIVQLDVATGINSNNGYCLSVIDYPSSGTHTYSLKVTLTSTTYKFGEQAGPVINATELTGVKGDTGSIGPTGDTGPAGAGFTPIVGTYSINTNLTAGSYAVGDTPIINTPDTQGWAEGQYIQLVDTTSGSTLVYNGILSFTSAGGFGTAFYMGTIVSVTGTPVAGTSSSWLMSLSGQQGNAGPAGPSGPTIYPSAGVAVSTGSAWDSSITLGTGVASALAVNTGEIGAFAVEGESPSFASVLATSNGTGQNFKVGDDVWLGDVNVANSFRVTGQEDATKGYIIFGNADTTALGRSGSGALTFGSDQVLLSSSSSTTGDIPLLTSAGQLTDSGKYLSDTVTTNQNIWSANQTQTAITAGLLNTPTLPVVTVATTANIALTGTQTIDGVAVVAGNYVLVKNQTTSSQNGVYVVAAGAWTRQAYVAGAYANVSAQVTYADLAENNGIINVLSGTVNKNLQFQLYFQNPSATLAAGTSVYVTNLIKVPVTSLFNRFVDTNIGNDTNYNGTATFPYATLTKALAGPLAEGFPGVVTIAPGNTDASAVSWTSTQANITVQSTDYCTASAGTVLTGTQTFTSGSTRNKYANINFTTGASAPFVHNTGAACRSYFQNLTISTTNTNWLGLNAGCTNWLTLDNIDFANFLATSVVLPSFSAAFTIYVANQTRSVLRFTGTGAANTTISIRNSFDGYVWIPSTYLGTINWNGAAFAGNVGSSAYTSGIVSDQTTLTNILNWTSDSTYDGTYAINFASPSAFAQGALFSKTTIAGTTYTYWTRTLSQAPSSITSLAGTSWVRTSSGWVNPTVLTGAWASIYDTTTSQAASAINTAYAMNLGSIDPDSQQISVASGTRITVANAGNYQFCPTIQVQNSDTVANNFTFWFRKNGTDIANSASYFAIPSSHGGTNGYSVPTVIYNLKLAANDYVEVMWSVDNTAVSIYTIPATSPAPQAPGVIVAVTAI